LVPDEWLIDSGFAEPAEGRSAYFEHLSARAASPASWLPAVSAV
jgi:hypothetical protein